MTPTGQLTEQAIQALLSEGTLAGSWTLDAARTQVRLKTRHTWGLLPLEGSFSQVSGNGTVTAAGEVSGVVTVGAASVDTKNPRRDKHLRSADFFDVENHPDFTFTAEGAAAAGTGVRITGSLTAGGQTRPASIDATVSTGDGELTLDGELHVNRADFGMKWNMIGMTPMHSTIVVHAVFTRQ